MRQGPYQDLVYLRKRCNNKQRNFYLCRFLCIDFGSLIIWSKWSMYAHVIGIEVNYKCLRESKSGIQIFIYEQKKKRP